MDAEIAKYNREYPNLDALMIETILNMSEDDHLKFQASLTSGETAEAPEKLILEDAIQVINSAAGDAQTDV